MLDRDPPLYRCSLLFISVSIPTFLPTLFSPFPSFSIFSLLFTSQDVSNANARNGANGKNGKPVVAKRSNGVKTRSMTIGNPNNNEIVLAPASRAGAAVAAAPSAREIFARGRAMADPNSYQITGASDDIDARDKEDPLCATEYVLDMYEYYREREIITSVRPTYMEAQPHINQRMRAILVDWLIEVRCLCCLMCCISSLAAILSHIKIPIPFQ